MDCRNARLLLEFACPRQGELEATESEALQQHLEQCPDCGQLADSDRRLDSAIGQAMAAVPVPAGLHARLLSTLEARRDAYHKKVLFRAAGAAAVLLVAAAGWFLTRGWWPARLDLDDIRQTAIAHFQASEGQVNEWLHDVAGRHVVAPPDFDYDKLRDYRLTTLQGHSGVPMLLFLHADEFGAYYAQVYVLDGRRFSFADLKVHNTGDGPQLRVRPHPNNPRVRYLVLYTAPPRNVRDDLQPFLRHPQKPEAHLSRKSRPQGERGALACSSLPAPRGGRG